MRLRTGRADGARPDHPATATMGDWLHHRLPPRADAAGLLARGDVVDRDGRPVRAADPYRPDTDVWIRRPLPADEPEVPGTLDVVFSDDRIVVVDKPPFLATMPRGAHVRQTVVTRLRDELDLPDLVPAHRLDRLTSGLLLLVIDPQWRGAYQTLFERRAVRKVYRAIAPLLPGAPGSLPIVVRNRIVKDRGVHQARVVPGEPNARTLVELEQILARPAPDPTGPTPEPAPPARALYRLNPTSGRTHQLRVHMSGLGVPIENDPLYPAERDVAPDDFARPLQLLAAELAFTDPVDATSRTFRSRRRLPLADPSLA